LLAAFWFIYLVNLEFPTYGQSVINAYMAKDLHMDRTMLGLAFSLYMLMVAAADLYPFPILLGFGWGATLVSMMGAPMNYFGLKAYPAVIELWLAIQTGIGAVAPFVASYVFDKYGSYTPVFYSIAGLCFAGSLLLLLATPPRRKASDEAPVPHAALRPARA
jgi:uncharacterized integral membrane protein